MNTKVVKDLTRMYECGSAIDFDLSTAGTCSLQGILAKEYNVFGGGTIPRKANVHMHWGGLLSNVAPETAIMLITTISHDVAVLQEQGIMVYFV